MSADDRIRTDNPRTNIVVGYEPYVVLMARHQAALRREMVARITKRNAAKQVTWTVASQFTWTATSRVRDAVARTLTGGAASRVAGSAARRVTSTIAVVVAMLLALATTASAKPTRDRDDDAEARDDDGDDRDDTDDRGGVALEIEPDAGSGATAGGPGLRSLPAIADVLEAAYDAAGLNRDPTRSWIRRARVAGLIPWVTVKTGWDQSWHDDEPGDVGRSRTFEVRATWRLDRLLFDGRELQMSSIDMARRRERRRLASRVIRAYFVWRKVAARGGLAAEAATAELDALTDGWFSERAKSGR